jgi:hypothetical protein
VENSIKVMVMNKHRFLRSAGAIVVLAFLAFSVPAPTSALGSSQNPQTSSFGLEGKISSPAPTQAATVGTPGNGQIFTSTPITVAGLCKTGLLIKVFSNNVFVGSTTCINGSYSLKVDLFSGQNDLVVRVYDSLDQPGPDSNSVSVRFNDAQYAQIGSRVSLSSNYARRGANPGVQLDWPIILSGGSGPYAVTVEWGDGSDTTLLSQEFAGELSIHHTYATSGVYQVIVKASDKNGSSAFLQLVGIANGEAKTQIASANGGNTALGQGSGNSFFQRYWPWLFVVMAGLMSATFWLGSRHELHVVRSRIERSRTVD